MLGLAQQPVCLMHPFLHFSLIHELMFLERIDLVVDVFIDTVQNRFLINIKLRGEEPEWFSRVSTNHVFKLFDEFLCLDGISFSLVSLPGNWNVFLLFCNLHLFTDLLLHPISEALRKLFERYHLRDGPSGANKNRNSGFFLLLHPLGHMHNRENESES